jgi:hypothetical protein
MLGMSSWTTFLYALLPHPDQPLVLTQADSGKITLPRMSHPERVWAANTRVLKPLLETTAGAPVNILRYAAFHRDEDLRESYQIHLLELRGSPPQNAFWRPPEIILEDGTLPLPLQEGLARWHEERRLGRTPERRAPWALPGWHARAERWIAKQVRLHGRGAIQRIEPIKSWSISCLFKVIMDSGIFYFKATRDLPLFVNEGVVLTRLARLYPARVPVPVALDPEEGWMLLEDFGEALGDAVSLEQQASFMQDFARVQIDSSGRIEALLAAGCKDRRIDGLFSQIEPLFEDELIMNLLTEEERAKLRQQIPQLRALLGEFGALPIPPALLHGDLHAGNVTLRDRSFLYFDWTDAAVSHPYLDMIHVFLEEDESKQAALQEAYLAVWEEHYPRADVRRAWELAGRVFGLYHAVSYQYIAHGIEEIVQPELNYSFYFLRRLLAGLEKPNAG